MKTTELIILLIVMLVAVIAIFAIHPFGAEKNVSGLAFSTSNLELKAASTQVVIPDMSSYTEVILDDGSKESTLTFTEVFIEDPSVKVDLAAGGSGSGTSASYTLSCSSRCEAGCGASGCDALAAGGCSPLKCSGVCGSSFGVCVQRYAADK